MTNQVDSERFRNLRDLERMYDIASEILEDLGDEETAKRVYDEAEDAFPEVAERDRQNSWGNKASSG